MSLDLCNEVTQFCRIHSRWIRARVVEGVMMAAIGGAQEKGFFAQLRKIFMIMVAKRRGRPALSWDISFLCDKLNECIINRPLAMHFTKSLLPILTSWDPRNETFSLVESLMAELSCV